jgi:DNA-binding XRE family transcriptional regulator
MDKLKEMARKPESDRPVSPVGATAAEASDQWAARSEEYRAARDEYRAISELRKKNWIAAHVRERRYELELTQQEVAEQAGTSHSYVSKLERGDHMPTIPVLQRILRVLDEELLIGIERQLPDAEPEREVAPAPELAVS